MAKEIIVNRVKPFVHHHFVCKVIACGGIVSTNVNSTNSPLGLLLKEYYGEFIPR